MQAFKKALLSQLEELMFYAISYSQMTVDQTERWISDPSEFIVDEIEDESFTASLRICVDDLILVLVDKFEKRTPLAIVAATNRVLQMGAEAQARGDEYWWKPCEAAVAAMHRSADMLMDLAPTGQASDSRQSSVVSNGGHATVLRPLPRTRPRPIHAATAIARGARACVRRSPHNQENEA